MASIGLRARSGARWRGGETSALRSRLLRDVQATGGVRGVWARARRPGGADGVNGYDPAAAAGLGSNPGAERCTAGPRHAAIVLPAPFCPSRPDFPTGLARPSLPSDRFHRYLCRQASALTLRCIDVCHSLRLHTRQ